jgi:hypothetical protein
MDPDQPVHPHILIRIHAIRLRTILQVEKLIANIIDPDQTAQMRKLVWIHAGRKLIMLVLSWCGSKFCFDKHICILIFSNNILQENKWMLYKEKV